MTSMSSGRRAKQFKRPEDHLAGADAATVGAIIASASDIAIIVDSDDTVQDFAVGAEDIGATDFADWLGHPVAEIFTVDSEKKVTDLIAGARRGEAPRWREVNHPCEPGEPDLPVRYCALPADGSGSVVLLGRDLRPVAALQRRIANFQQSLERDYSRLLQMETRYRLLFQSASEAFLVIDAGSMRVLEANAAAGALFGRSAEDLTRRRFPTGLDDASIAALDGSFSNVRTTGKPETLSVTLADSGRAVDAFVSLFRAESTKNFLVRLSTAGPDMLTASEGEAQVVGLFRHACEGIVLTDAEGRIEWANDAFLDLVQAAVEGQVQGENIDGFFARQGIDLPLILSNTREGGRLRYYSTSIAGQHGLITDVEVSSVLLKSIGGKDGGSGYGFVFRNTAFRPTEATTGNALPHSPEQLTDLIGRVPLKDLVRETVDVIERLCIEAALRMTRDNRASAADLLGLSRQSLYVKLRRYGLGTADSDAQD